MRIIAHTINLTIFWRPKMTTNNFLVNVLNATENNQIISLVESKYNMHLSQYVRKVISVFPEGVFFDDTHFCRKLSLSEILSAESDLHVCFSQLGFLPLFDKGENDFIVFESSSNAFSLFNICDELIFKTSNNLSDLF